MKINNLFTPFLEFLRKEHRTERTIEEYERFLYGPILEAVGEKELSEIKVTDRANIIDHAYDYGQTAPQRAVVDFRMLLKFAKDSGYSVPIDYRDLKVPKLKKPEVVYFSKEEEDAIRASLVLSGEKYCDLVSRCGRLGAERYKMTILRMAAYFELYIAVGLRLSEGSVLLKSDITWGDPGEIRTWNCKTKEHEKLFINCRAQDKLREYFKERKDKLPYVFVSSDRMMTPNAARKWLWKHSKKLSINKRFTSRIMRKTFTTNLLLEGADIKSVQFLSRHESPTTTLNHYAAVVKEQCRSVYHRAMNKPFVGVA